MTIPRSRRASLRVGLTMVALSVALFTGVTGAGAASHYTRIRYAATYPAVSLSSSVLRVSAACGGLYVVVECSGSGYGAFHQPLVISAIVAGSIQPTTCNPAYICRAATELFGIGYYGASPAVFTIYGLDNEYTGTDTVEFQIASQRGSFSNVYGEFLCHGCLEISP